MVEALYPRFVPPSALTEKHHREWSKREADEYCKWLTGCVQERTNALLLFFEFDADVSKAREVLQRVGFLLTERLGEDSFAVQQPDGTRALTSVGHSLAADVGLLIARRLVELSAGKLRWEVVRKPRSDMSYNLPVLVGFSNDLTLDPIGGSIAEAIAVLAGRDTSDAWARVLDFWSRQV